MLNKKALLPYADPGLTMPLNHGLLHAGQVGYLLRTAVRRIDRRRTLAIYVYKRERAERGDFTPTWAVFYVKGGYVTLAHGKDGAVKWRTAAFDRLGTEWRFTDKCAFFSAADEQRVKSYLHDQEHDGVTALVSAQRAIQDARRKKRQHSRERKTLARMSAVKAAPRGLKNWIRKSVMPAYFLCDHASARKPVTGLCTACGHEATLERAEHNGAAICPHCGHKLTVKSRAKFGHFFDRDTVQVVQRAAPGELVVRIFKVYYNYKKDAAPTQRIYEAARIFASRGPDGQAVFEPYRLDSGDLTDWKPGLRPAYICYQYQFDGDLCGYVYRSNLPQALAGTPWKYCPIDQFCRRRSGHMELTPFLRAYLEHPRMEHLVKTGFCDLVSDLVYRHIQDGLLDESQHRTHRILGVAPEDVDFLREMGIDASDLETFHKYAGIKDRQPLIRWQRERRVMRDVLPILKRVTAHKLMKYADAQFDLLHPRDKKGRYRGHQDVVSEYRDYLDMCAKLDYAAKSKSVLFPKDLQKAHDRAAKQVKLQHDKLARRNFKEAYRRITGHLDFTCGGLQVVYPKSLKALAEEGSALQHCVGNYGDRIANRECIILFLRRCSEPEKPFYTMEVRDGHITQLRGLQNCAPTPEVQRFAEAWERSVLQAPAVAEAA